MMKFSQLRTKWIRKIRILTICLIVSGVLNGLFLLGVIYSLFKEREGYTSYVLQKVGYKVQEKEFSNQEYLAYFSDLSFRELLTFLSNKEPLEEGYLKRDLALAVLCEFYNFNIDKAITGDYQRREVIFHKKNKEYKIVLFPEMTDAHYQSIIHYATVEKWPFTTKGIYVTLKNWPEPKDQSLKQAFMLTSEFELIKNLFHQGGMKVESEMIIKTLLDGEWPIIENFAKRQKTALDFSEQARRRLLFDFFLKGSKNAAMIFLQTDFIYVVKRFSDRHILGFLKLFDERTDDVEHFCAELLKSPRGQAVWQKSSDLLYRFFQEKPPEVFNRQIALERFVLSNDLKNKWHDTQAKNRPLGEMILVKKSPEKKQIHVIQDGENLWKIARKYKVELDELIKVNHLENNKIFPGKEIIIPQH